MGVLLYVMQSLSLSSTPENKSPVQEMRQLPVTLSLDWVPVVAVAIITMWTSFSVYDMFRLDYIWFLEFTASLSRPQVFFAVPAVDKLRIHKNSIWCVKLRKWALTFWHSCHVQTRLDLVSGICKLADIKPIIRGADGPTLPALCNRCAWWKLLISLAGTASTSCQFRHGVNIMSC